MKEEDRKYEEFFRKMGVDMFGDDPETVDFFVRESIKMTGNPSFRNFVDAMIRGDGAFFAGFQMSSPFFSPISKVWSNLDTCRSECPKGSKDEKPTVKVRRSDIDVEIFEDGKDIVVSLIWPEIQTRHDVKEIAKVGESRKSKEMSITVTALVGEPPTLKECEVTVPASESNKFNCRYKNGILNIRYQRS